MWLFFAFGVMVNDPSTIDCKVGSGFYCQMLPISLILLSRSLISLVKMSQAS